MAFLARQYVTYELPKEKRYLLKYFDTEIQTAFLKYVFVFGDYANFTDHTGLKCQRRWLDTLYNKLTKIEAVHREAKSDLTAENLSKLALIESGKYKL